MTILVTIAKFPYLIISLFYIVTLGAWSWLGHELSLRILQ